MGSRTWIKLYCAKWIEGTIREERPEIRGIWADLLALAGSGEYGDDGEIKLVNGVGLNDIQISEILNIKKALWKRAKKRFLESQRIEIKPKGAIRIVNWKNYQSEYERQKKYRKQKTDQAQAYNTNPPLVNPLRDRERDRDRE